MRVIAISFGFSVDVSTNVYTLLKGLETFCFTKKRLNRSRYESRVKEPPPVPIGINLNFYTREFLNSK